MSPDPAARDQGVRELRPPVRRLTMAAPASTTRRTLGRLRLALLVATVAVLVTSVAAFVGATDLWYASRLLHAPDDGILAQLGTLGKLQSDALAEQLSSGWLNPWTTLVWALPIAVLLALLWVAQVFLKRRFRRMLNFPL